MKIKNIRKCCISFMMLLLVWMFGTFGAQAQTMGSVSMLLPAQADGVEITLYTVADYQEDAQQFVYREAFANSGINLTDIEEAEEAQQAAAQFAALAKEKGVAGLTKTADAGGSLSFIDLAPGYYLFVQTGGEDSLEVQKALVPIPYMIENNELRYDAVISPKYEVPEGAAILNKKDDDGNRVGQAQFVLERKVYVGRNGEMPESVETGMDGGGRFFWEEYKSDLLTDEKGQLILTHLPLGMYRLVETAAPAGFILNSSPNYFSIEKGGEVRLQGGIYVPASNNVPQVDMVNKQVTLLVNKVDENGNPLAGATLVLKDANGQGIYARNGSAMFSFTTTEEPYVLKRVPAGTYFLCEVQSPEGYLVAQDVPLVISDEEGVVNTVTMVDKKEQPTLATLTVTKRLYDGLDHMLAARDGKFYVALFEDAEKTVRVSDVKELHYVGTSSETVQFSNLEMDKTYYIAETDEFGIPMESGTVGDAVFMPDFPFGYEITPTKGEPEHQIEFENHFYDIPMGYFFNGEITVTKEVLLGGEPYETDDVFYAAAFKDKECTQQEGQVAVIAMDGSSSASATIIVFIGETIDSSATYYVTETDENGVPLNPENALGFYVSVEGGDAAVSDTVTQVDFSPEKSTANVTIINDFEEEQTETEEETETESDTEPQTQPTQPGTNTPPATPGTPTSPDAVRTGDNTPIAVYVALFIISAAAILTVIVKKRKK